MWYEKFELKEDPYDIRNLSENVIGEEAQEAQLIKWIGRGRACLLYGPTGVGKTTLARMLVKRLEKREIPELFHWDVLYYSCDRDSLQDIPTQVENAKQPFAWLRWLARKTRKNKKAIVVFLDEIHFGDPRDVIRVSAYWDIHKIHSVVYIQIAENPTLPQLVRRIGPHKVRMRTINRDEIATLIRQRTGDVQVLDELAILHIASNCGLNPSIALQHCAQVAEDLAHPGKPILLDQVKTFHFEDTALDREIPAAQDVQGDTIDRLSTVGPAHKKILRQLRISSTTINDLATACGMKPKPVAARLGELRKKDMVEEKDSSRPKRFGLVPEFERELLSDET